MTKWKKNLLFLFYLLAGIILGAVLARLCAGVPFLSWLSYGESVGISAGSIDLAILDVTFGFSLSINVAQIITVGVAMWLYGRSRWR
ncbi:MAG: DUF4321 domain-containing protein [Oscillospiraceae bacterium]|nr:DUF4321 domain-containing protein [Oscillospiraceae bacterium]